MDPADKEMIAAIRLLLGLSPWPYASEQESSKRWDSWPTGDRNVRGIQTLTDDGSRWQRARWREH